jgi:hypothetical protein
MEHLASLKRIAAPENLHEKRMRFSIPVKEVKVFTVAEVNRASAH